MDSIVPAFRDFVPAWVRAQPWYAGTGVGSMTPVAFIRIEDPAGEVGMESHILSDGGTAYHVPMTYRGAPLAGDEGLITTARHSRLGPRWIYDASYDPVWVTEVLRLVDTGSATVPQADSGPGSVVARGLLVAGVSVPPAATVEVRRVLGPPPPDGEPSVLGVVTTDLGCLAVVRSGL